MSKTKKRKRKNNESNMNSFLSFKRHVSDGVANNKNKTKSFSAAPGDSPHYVLGDTGTVYLDWSMLALRKLVEESFWLEIMTVSTFIAAVKQPRSDCKEPYDMAYDEFEASGTTAADIDKSDARMAKFHKKNKMICLLITGKPYAAHYQFLLIDCTKKEVTLIEHSSSKPVDCKQIAEIEAVLESLGWSARPVIKPITLHPTRSIRRVVGGDIWTLYHVQLGNQQVRKGKEIPLCGPVACNVYRKLLLTQEESANKFCDPKWYDDLCPQEPIRCRMIMAHSLKKELPMFIKKQSCTFTAAEGAGTSSKLDYALGVLEMSEDCFETALGEKGDTCPVCAAEYQDSDYVYICRCCGLIYHPSCFIKRCIFGREGRHWCCPLCLREDVHFGVVEVKSMATVETVKFKEDAYQLQCQLLCLGKEFDGSKTYIIEDLKIQNDGFDDGADEKVGGCGDNEGGGNRLSADLSLVFNHAVQSKLDTMQMEAQE